MNLRDNLSRADTRWLSIGTLIGVVLTLIGVGLCIAIIVTIAAGQTVATGAGTSAASFLVVGIVLVVSMSIALSKRTSHRTR